MLAAGFVAFAALRFCVLAEKPEVGEVVVERFLVEPHDIGIASFMVRVAGCAAGIGRIGGLSVKPCSGAYVGGYVLMTVEAQCALFCAFEFRVAGTAFFLVLCMTFDDLTGHDQRFDLGNGLFGNHAQKCHCGSGQ